MEIFAGEVRTNEISEKSKGGSELVARRMAADLDKTVSYTHLVATSSKESPP